MGESSSSPFFVLTVSLVTDFMRIAAGGRELCGLFHEQGLGLADPGKRAGRRERVAQLKYNLARHERYVTQTLPIVKVFKSKLFPFTDNPYHMTQILGGLWGLAKKLDESLTTRIYNLILNSEPNDTAIGHSNPRGIDQIFLSEHIWPIFLENRNVTVHDSYTCLSFGIDSKAFPTRRKGNCFVGQIGPCNQTSNSLYK